MLASETLCLWYINGLLLKFLSLTYVTNRHLNLTKITALSYYVIIIVINVIISDNSNFMLLCWAVCFHVVLNLVRKQDN